MDRASGEDERSKEKSPLISYSGQRLTRSVAFQFTLDPTLDQRVLFAKCAGARRFAFNHHLGRVKENQALRDAEKGAVIGPPTPALSWKPFSLINEFNAWKNGELDSSPVNEDGTKGLSWRHEIPSDVFECASVDAAAALKNFSESRKGDHAGARVGFPHFAAKGRSTPSFRRRNQRREGITQAIRFTDASHLRLPKIGAVKVFGPTRQVRRMLAANRLHIYSATLTYRGGRWLVSLTGVAPEFNRARRSNNKRHQASVGIDRGITSLAVAADADGHHLKTFEGVKQLRIAEHRLTKAQKALARTTPGSKGRATARAILNKRHRKVVLTRKHLVHQASSWFVTHCSTLVLEDLNVAGMVQNRRLSKALHDAAMGELRRQIEYKAGWYGVEVIVAGRFFPSSKTCSGCGHVKDLLSLSRRTYHCEACDLSIDRDLNAAVNLARLGDKDVVAEAEALLRATAVVVI
jgi:putative transposase